MLRLQWRSLVSVLFISAAPSFAVTPLFENTAVVRTIELGGSLVHVSTTYAIKALEPNSKVYTIALGQDEVQKASWLDVKVKNSGNSLPVTNHGFDMEHGCYLLDVTLPQPMKVGDTMNLLLEAVETHATWPWPPTAGQQDGQALKYETDLFVLSPYETYVMRNRIKSTSPGFKYYTTPTGVDIFTSEGPVSKSGATVTYGPYNQVPSSANRDFIDKYQQKLLVHFDYDYPVLEVTKLRRSAEISHWGANLNIQNEIHLHNAGPTLKGHFSRLEHQTQAFYKRPAPHMLPSLTFQLPPGIRNTYYYDLNGNISTSQLRAAPSPLLRPAKGQYSQFSTLELKPRYPLMGGWNYSFTLGWDAPLADSVSWDSDTGKYVAQIPVLTEIPSAVVDDAELTIVLPEGAIDVDFMTPFPALSAKTITHLTYLDTVGRPAIIFRYKDLTFKHAQAIYVTYRVPLSAHLKKPLAVTTAFLGLFALGFAIRRIDLTLQKRKK